MNMKFLRTTEGNNFLTELEDKQLQLYGQIKGMDRAGIQGKHSIKTERKEMYGKT
jgi:hypothetical protein